MHAAERMKRDALQLMELSDSQTEIPSASLHAQVQFKDAGSRKKLFLDEYMGLVKQLVEKKYQITDAKRMIPPMLIKCCWHCTQPSDREEPGMNNRTPLVIWKTSDKSLKGQRSVEKVVSLDKKKKSSRSSVRSNF